MKNKNPFKIGDIVNFKEDNDEYLIFKQEQYTVSSVSGHCLYVEPIYDESFWNGNMPPIPSVISFEAWHYKALELTK